MQSDIRKKMDSRLRGISGDERYPHYSITLPAPASHGKLFSLRALPLFLSWSTVGFPTLYPNKGESFKIIGSHTQSSSVMFQTACLWSHGNFDHNSCVSNETKPAGSTRKPCPARFWGQLSQADAALGIQGEPYRVPGLLSQVPSAVNYYRLWKGFGEWLLLGESWDQVFFGKVLRIHFDEVMLTD